MKNIFAFLLFLVVLGSCKGDDLSQDPNVLEGVYRTNAFLDPLCIAITDENQLPRLDIVKKNNGTFDLTRTNFIPQPTTQKLSGITIKEVKDGLELYYENTKVGTYVVGKWYDDKKDKEVSSKVLMVSYSNQSKSEFFFYAGVKK